MQKKKVILTGLVLGALASTASAKPLSVKKFCSLTLKHHALVKYSVANGGDLGRDMNFTISDQKTGREIMTINDQDSSNYRGCSQPISWMEKVRTALCKFEKPRKGVDNINDVEIDVPASIVFLFEGAGDFNSGRAKSVYGTANLSGNEGKDLNMGNFNGGGAFRSALIGRYSSFPETPQIHYHASSGFHSKENLTSAKACFKLMDNYLDILKSKKADFVAPKMVVFGYSNGAHNALRFQSVSKKSKRDIDLLVSIDPIPQTLFYPLGKAVNLIKSRKTSTKRLVNLYQTDDYDSLPILKLRGKPVKDADLNIHVSSENDAYRMSSDGRRNHIYITSSELTRKTISCEVKKLFDLEENCEE